VTPLLEVRDLCRHFGGVRAVDGVSFTVPEGGVHAVIGPNGAGKTTLFNVITGVLPPSSGEVVFRGERVDGLPPEKLAARGISRTFQNLRIFFDMTVLENVLVGRHLHLHRGLFGALFRTPAFRRSEAEARAFAEHLLERVGLAEVRDREAESLPYGALKRLEIARALACEPKLLLLDEPAAGCNEAETREIGRLVEDIAAEGITVMLVEHDMHLVMSTCDHIIVLDHGRLLAEGPPAQIRADPRVIEAYLGRSAREPARAARG